MNAWALPGAAATFWTGLLAWEAHPYWLAPWMTLLVGMAGLIGAWLAAPHAASGPDPLEALGLARAEPSTIRAVAPPRASAGAPFAALALAVTGLFALGVGWAGLHQAWLDDSLLARMSPRRVTVEGSLLTDPEPGAFGWYATVEVSRIAWPDGAATLHTSIWLNANGDPPDMVRGDRLSAEGVIRRPDNPAF
ncbi:MAG: DUF4131 domain-containing protein, partial [Actinomycetota bacterium]